MDDSEEAVIPDIELTPLGRRLIGFHLHSADGEADGEGGAVALAEAFGMDGAAVQLDDVADDG